MGYNKPMQYLAIIGREKSLACAELESEYSAIEKVGTEAVTFDLSKRPKISSLGSVIKLGEVFDETQISANYLAKIIARVASHFEASSVKSVDYGVSVYGNGLSQGAYKNILIQIKKGLRQRNIKSRFVTPKAFDLNSAQVKHNKLIGTGIEIIIVMDGSRVLLAQTIEVQDVDSYSLRDFGRPSRDMKVGMFPPKLAQSMISLASIDPQSIVYDPFCGSGVVMQEAMLRGNTAWGSDISEPMVRSTTENINWLINQYNLAIPFKVFEADATKITTVPDSEYSIVTEGYLGTMLSNSPTVEQLTSLRAELSELYLGFLKNILSLRNKPNSVVLSIPCWQTNNGLEMLEIIDQIKKLGYTVKQFKSVGTTNLIYKREEQIVGRQILALGYI